jgi:hypothetical protein
VDIFISSWQNGNLYENIVYSAIENTDSPVRKHRFLAGETIVIYYIHSAITYIRFRDFPLEE